MFVYVRTRSVTDEYFSAVNERVEENMFIQRRLT